MESQARHGAPGVLKTCVLQAKMPLGRKWSRGTYKTSYFFVCTGKTQGLHHQQNVLPSEPLALTSQPPWKQGYQPGICQFLNKDGLYGLQKYLSAMQ